MEIYIEHCCNCTEHQGYTRHTEKSYVTKFNNLAEALLSSFPSTVRVVGNPQGKPRLASFEVKLVIGNNVNVLLFSKFTMRRFPVIDDILPIINDKMTKFGYTNAKLMKSAPSIFLKQYSPSKYLHGYPYEGFAHIINSNHDNDNENNTKYESQTENLQIVANIDTTDNNNNNNNIDIEVVTADSKKNVFPPEDPYKYDRIHFIQAKKERRKKERMLRNVNNVNNVNAIPSSASSTSLYYSTTTRTVNITNRSTMATPATQTTEKVKEETALDKKEETDNHLLVSGDCLYPPERRPGFQDPLATYDPRGAFRLFVKKAVPSRSQTAKNENEIILLNEDEKNANAAREESELVNNPSDIVFGMWSCCKSIDATNTGCRYQQHQDDCLKCSKCGVVYQSANNKPTSCKFHTSDAIETRFGGIVWPCCNDGSYSQTIYNFASSTTATRRNQEVENVIHIEGCRKAYHQPLHLPSSFDTKCSCTMCGKEYEEESNGSHSCCYHPGFWCPMRRIRAISQYKSHPMTLPSNNNNNNNNNNNDNNNNNRGNNNNINVSHTIEGDHDGTIRNHQIQAESEIKIEAAKKPKRPVLYKLNPPAHPIPMMDELPLPKISLPKMPPARVVFNESDINGLLPPEPYLSPPEISYASQPPRVKQLSQNFNIETNKGTLNSKNNHGDHDVSKYLPPPLPSSPPPSPKVERGHIGANAMLLFGVDENKFELDKGKKHGIPKEDNDLKELVMNFIPPRIQIENETMIDVYPADLLCNFKFGSDNNNNALDDDHELLSSLSFKLNWEVAANIEGKLPRNGLEEDKFLNNNNNGNHSLPDVGERAKTPPLKNENFDVAFIILPFEEIQPSSLPYDDDEYNSFTPISMPSKPLKAITQLSKAITPPRRENNNKRKEHHAFPICNHYCLNRVYGENGNNGRERKSWMMMEPIRFHWQQPLDTESADHLEALLHNQSVKWWPEHVDKQIHQTYATNSNSNDDNILAIESKIAERVLKETFAPFQPFKDINRKHNNQDDNESLDSSMNLPLPPKSSTTTTQEKESIIPISATKYVTEGGKRNPKVSANEYNQLLKVEL